MLMCAKLGPVKVQAKCSLVHMRPIVVAVPLQVCMLMCAKVGPVQEQVKCSLVHMHPIVVAVPLQVCMLMCAHMHMCAFWRIIYAHVCMCEIMCVLNWVP
jgi:hypothetical protein